ncbi:MAG: cytochrome P450 [Steroidobacteraceae bacterium]
MSEASALRPQVPKPSHVPDSLVYEFDFHHDPALMQDPHRRVLDVISKAPPVFWTPRNGGHWMIIGYNAVFKASRDTEAFSSTIVSAAQMKALMAMSPAGAGRIPQARPINLDPPEHGKFRAPLQRAFSPKSVLAMKDDIRALADLAIDAFVRRGHCEFMAEFAERLPVQVFLKMFGLPVERQAEYRALVKEHLSDISQDPVKSIMKLRRIAEVMRETILARRDNPRDDLLSALWQAGIDGRPTTLEDMDDYAVLLFIAGLDTVVNGLGFAMRHLAQDPALQEKLRANPKLIPEASEEMLRRYTFTVPVRRVGKDMVFDGVTMKEGERVMLYLPAADLDQKQFPHPDQYELNREEKAHIAFGGGPHRCLGSHLARVELQTAYEQMLSRLPDFRLDPKKPVKFHGGHVTGVDSLPLVWDV